MRRSRKEGYWTWPNAPYGYDLVQMPPQGVLAPNAHAPVVRGIFLSLAAGALPLELARRLEDAKAPTPGALRGRPGAWSPNTLLAIWRNPVYMGYVPNDGKLEAGLSEALVSEALWEAAQPRRRRERDRATLAQQKAQEQRQAFEEGYWHHQRTPRGCVRTGEWPRYTLAPGPEFEKFRPILEALAKGVPLAEVELMARPLFADELATWQDPAKAVAKAIRRHVLHPVFGGNTAWGNRTGRLEVREARWGPFVPREVWHKASRRIHRARFTR